MRAKTILITLLTFLINNLSFSQSTECLRDFDFLVKKIQADYPGYITKVTDFNRSQLMLLEKELRQKIEEYPDSCWYYLNDYTDFFKDYHLRVNRIRNDEQQFKIMDISTYGKNLYVNVDSLHEKTMNTTGIEGVWKGFRQEITITKDGQKYVGVIVNRNGWKNGQIKYEFKPINDTVFYVTNYSLIKNKTTYQTRASLHLNGKILEFHDDTRLIRKSNSEIIDKSLLYSYVPKFPNGSNTYPLALYMDDITYYIRIPDFYSNTGNEYILKHWQDITSRPNLIIILEIMVVVRTTIMKNLQN